MTDRVLADLKAMVFSPGRRLNHAVRVICRPIFHVSSRPTILHPERVLPVNLYRPGRKDAADGEGPVKTGGGGPGGGAGGAGGCLLAINHHHPLDIPALFYATPRLIDFVSIAEVMGVKGLGAFYRQFDTITLNRGTVDPAAIRTIVARLRAGRAVGFFPEAKITSPQESVTAGGGHRPGLGRIARLAGVPVLPVVVLDSQRFMKPTAWLPLRQTRFAVAFGEPLRIREDMPARESQHELEARWRESILRLIDELATAGYDVSQIRKKPAD